MFGEFLSNTLFVIVLYKKKWTDTSLFALLRNDRTLSDISLFIYDNSPNAQLITDNHIIYKHDLLNSGVSKAYNEAAHAASQMNKRWLLLLDQDTTLTHQMLSAYQQAILTHTKISLFTPVVKDAIGIVSPFRMILGKGIRIKNVKPGIYSTAHRYIVNSGMLIRLDAFLEVGGFDERFPLDLSDVVFLDRLQTRYPEFVVIDAECCHNLSSSDSSIEMNEALRRFTIFCNALQLYEKVSKKYLWPRITILMRSVRYFFQYWNVQFIKIALS